MGFTGKDRFDLSSGVRADASCPGQEVLFGLAFVCPVFSSNSKFKKLGRIRGGGDCRVREHKVNQMLPTVKKQILSEAENISKETLASASLEANLLVG